MGKEVVNKRSDQARGLQSEMFIAALVFTVAASLHAYKTATGADLFSSRSWLAVATQVVIAYGMFRKSFTSHVLGVLWFVLPKLIALPLILSNGQPLIVIVACYFLVRGAIASYKYQRDIEHVPLPSMVLIGLAILMAITISTIQPQADEFGEPQKTLAREYSEGFEQGLNDHLSGVGWQISNLYREVEDSEERVFLSWGYMDGYLRGCEESDSPCIEQRQLREEFEVHLTELSR